MPGGTDAAATKFLCWSQKCRFSILEKWTLKLLPVGNACTDIFRDRIIKDEGLGKMGKDFFERKAVPYFQKRRVRLYQGRWRV